MIRGDQAEEESTLVNEITRNGFFLPVYLGDRLTGPQFNFNGTVEAAMHYMIGRMEKIPLLQIGATTGDTTKCNSRQLIRMSWNTSRSWRSLQK